MEVIQNSFGRRRLSRRADPRSVNDLRRERVGVAAGAELALLKCYKTFFTAVIYKSATVRRWGLLLEQKPSYRLKLLSIYKWKSLLEDLMIVNCSTNDMMPQKINK